MWGEYTIRPIDEVMVFDNEIPFEKLALSFVNPMTAYGFIETLNEHKAKAVVQNGANGALGRIFIKLCNENNIEIINVVRKEEQIKILNDFGAKYVISTSSPTWEKELAELANKLGAKYCFEAVGGEFTGRMISAMPNGSTIYHYGNLEMKQLTRLLTMDFIFKGKTLKGWILSKFFRETPKQRIREIMGIFKEEFSKENSYLETTYSKVFSLEEYEKAMEYYVTNMSQGKVIMKPHGDN
jgi:NADPH:quinone reductase-like Zn-dependent oxidoreductase